MYLHIQFYELSPAFCWQIGLSADGMLEGIKITYYSDLGINPADSGLSAMVLGMDNGQLH